MSQKEIAFVFFAMRRLYSREELDEFRIGERHYRVSSKDDVFGTVDCICLEDGITYRLPGSLLVEYGFIRGSVSKKFGDLFTND